MIEKRFESNGYPCLVKRIDGMGHLCGYVGVPKGNRWYGKTDASIYDTLDNVPSVHGGITYGRPENPDTREKDGLWWIGFDCGHYGDYLPWMPDSGGHRWTVDEVADETSRLAEQLAEVDHA